MRIGKSNFFNLLYCLKGDFLYDYVFSGSDSAGRRLFTYGRLVERVSRIDDRQAPAVAHPDGVDYVPMKTWRIFLIQLFTALFPAPAGAGGLPLDCLWYDSGRRRPRFSVILLLLIGINFSVGPAALIAVLTPEMLNTIF